MPSADVVAHGGDAPQSANCRRAVDLVHFDGHGTFLPEIQLGALVFEKPDDGTGESKTDLVRADRLGDLLAQYKIPLVVLEACRSATVGKAAVFRSVAPRLIQAGVASVLSMSHAVHVEAARLLLDRFYRELAAGATIGHAVAQARGVSSQRPFAGLNLDQTAERSRWKTGSCHTFINAASMSRCCQCRRQSAASASIRCLPQPQPQRLGACRIAGALLSEKHGIRVWLDKWECGPGKLEPQCEVGIRDSRFTLVVGSQSALNSKWVAWEIKKHKKLIRTADRLLPVKFESLELPPNLEKLLWVDFTDRAMDQENAALVTRHIRSADAEDARRRRGFRPPPDHGRPVRFRATAVWFPGPGAGALRP